MSYSRLLKVFLLSLVGMAAFSQAQAEENKLVSKRSELLVEPEDLIKMPASSMVRLIDTRDLEAYKQGHLPGAVYADIGAWKKLSAQPETLADAKSWEEPLARLGIQQDMRVIVYGDPLSETARMWWLLKYLGVKNVAILDGGFKSWVASGGSPSRETVELAKGTSTVKLESQRLIELSELLDSCVEQKKATLIDNRSAAEFSGKAGASQRKGHIPGACHVEWLVFLDTDGRFLSDEQLHEKLADAQLDPSQQIILHCQTGGRSSVGAFVIEMLGYPQVANYYNGWAQYSADTKLPVIQDQKP